MKLAALLLLAFLIPFAWIIVYANRALRRGGDTALREYGRVDGV